MLDGQNEMLTPDLVRRGLEFVCSLTRQLKADHEDALPLVVLGTDLLGEPSIGVDWTAANSHPDHDEIESAVQRAFRMGLNYAGDQDGRPIAFVSTEGSHNDNAQHMEGEANCRFLYSDVCGDALPAGECCPDGCTACASCSEKSHLRGDSVLPVP